MSPTYGHMTKLFLESEFQHKGNKQRKKRKISAKSYGLLGRNRFKKKKLFKYYAEKGKNKLDKIVINRTVTYL